MSAFFTGSLPGSLVTTPAMEAAMLEVCAELWAALQRAEQKIPPANIMNDNPTRESFMDYVCEGVSQCQP
jgi:hypothetical protein